MAGCWGRTEHQPGPQGGHTAAGLQSQRRGVHDVFVNGTEGVMRVRSGVNTPAAARGGGVPLRAHSAQLLNKWTNPW